MRRLVLVFAALLGMSGCGSDENTGPSSFDKSGLPLVTGKPSAGGGLVFATASLDGLTISTDKDDYAPGDTVLFTGSGWSANDTLDIVLSDEPETHPPHTWTIVVGPDGTFRDSTYVVDIGDLGVTFTLTAVSRATGQSLAVLFTDGTARIDIAPAFYPASPGPVRFSVLVRNIAGTGVRCARVTVPAGYSSVSLDTAFAAVAGWTYVQSGNVLTITGASVLSPGATNWARFEVEAMPPATTSATWSALVAENLGCTTNPSTNGGAVQIGSPQQWTYTADFRDVGGAVIAAETGTPGVSKTFRLRLTNTSGGSGDDLKYAVIALPYCFAAPPSASAVSSNGGETDFTAEVRDNFIRVFNGTLKKDVNPDHFVQVTFTTTPSSDCSPVFRTAGWKSSEHSSSGPDTFVGNHPSITVQAAGPTKLAFTTSAFSATVGQCSPLISVQTQNAASAPTNVTSNTTVNLTSDGAGGFFSDNTCATTISGVQIATGGNLASFYYKATAVGDGTHLLTASATGLTSATQTETITAIPNAAPTVSAGTSYGAAEGTSIAMASASATDPDGDPLTFKWTYVPNGAVDAGTTCAFSDDEILQPTFTCNDDGSFTVTLAVNDGNGHTPSATAAVLISNANPAATFAAPAPVAEGTSFTLSLTGANDPGDNDDAGLTFAFDCGDGAGYAAASATASRTCPTSDNGSRAVKAKVLDNDTGVGEYTGSVTVNNAAPTASFSATPSSVNEGGSYTLALASPADPSTSDVTAGLKYAFDCGDGSGYGSAISYATASSTASATCPAADNVGSPRTARGRIFDKDDGATEYTASVAVGNVPPSLSAITAPIAPVLENSSITASATFTDPGQDDDPWNYSINWGDGSLPTTGAVNTWASTMSISGSHAYTDPGVYTIVMTVTDKEGGSDTEEFQYVVVYDPTAGFVTGGGWINSPPGACRYGLCQEGTVGKANFGFVSKYLKGASQPTGNTQFQFHAGELDFKSTTYQWLVVQGKDRASFKGYGTIDGAGNYGFLLSAVDAATGDRFRIKIWEATTGTVVYDNQMGAPDDAQATMVIANGSIVVHTPK